MLLAAQAGSLQNISSNGCTLLHTMPLTTHTNLDEETSKGSVLVVLLNA